MFNKRENHLLATLDAADDALLSPHLSVARFVQGTILQEQDAPIVKVYFPMSGLVSLVSVMEDGREIESAVLGRNGAVGAFVGVGSPNAWTRATVQVPATCAVVTASHFCAVVSQSTRLRDVVLRFREALLGHTQQTAACNALHSLEARVARLLLQALDLTDERELPLTQDAIARMLAVRRTSVTLVAARLQADGLIRCRRGRIVILNKGGLEHLACECYRAIRRRVEKVAPAVARFAMAEDLVSSA
jgi:CRP-like cAMP-binding protein